MESAPARVVFPQVGELLAGFRLLAELGRGAAGRVFLAAQPSLGDRPVVLKVTPRGREEHLSLARLQHTNIVPLYSEHVLRDRNLQILCMPFLGGATMAQVLEALADRPAAAADRETDSSRPWTGSSPGGMTACNRAVRSAGSSPSHLRRGHLFDRGGARRRIAVCPRTRPRPYGRQAVQCAPGRRRPADAAGFPPGPQPDHPGSPPPEWMGGTLEFMSPEHWRAVEAVREGRPVRDAVDGRADIYSLGMLLYVALGGVCRSRAMALWPRSIAATRGSPSGSRTSSTSASGAIPRDRYRDAASLADDLRRHLADLPLRGVPNRSWPERWRKWRRRHPRPVAPRVGRADPAGGDRRPGGDAGHRLRQRRPMPWPRPWTGVPGLESRRYAEASASAAGHGDH